MITCQEDPFEGKYDAGFVIALSKGSGSQLILAPKGLSETYRSWKWYLMHENLKFLEPIPTEEEAVDEAHKFLDFHETVWVWKIYYSNLNRRFRLFEPAKMVSRLVPEWKEKIQTDEDLVTQLANKFWEEAVQKLPAFDLRRLADAIWNRWHLFNKQADEKRDKEV